MRKIRKIASVLYWFLFLFLKRPKFEYFCKKLDVKNRHYAELIKKEVADNRADYLSVYEFKKIPKKIWIYWDEGEQNAHFLVKACIKSWRMKNSDWDLIVLDKSSISEYVDMPTVPGFLPVQKYANLLRLELLRKYGGVWVDATTYCHRPLDEWLPMLAYSGFFVFRNPGPDREIENWFIAATPMNELVIRWADSLNKCYNSLMRPHPAYFIAFYVFQWMLKCEKPMEEMFRRCSGLSAGPTFIMLHFIEDRLSFDMLKPHILSGLPLSKLNWRARVDEDNLENILSKIENLKCNG